MNSKQNDFLSMAIEGDYLNPHQQDDDDRDYMNSAFVAEASELRKKAEKKDIELKKKDKDILQLQKENHKLNRSNEELIEEVKQLKANFTLITQESETAKDILKFGHTKEQYDNLKQLYEKARSDAEKSNRRYEACQSQVDTLESRLKKITIDYQSLQNQLSARDREVAELIENKAENIELEANRETYEIEKIRTKQMNLQLIDEIDALQFKYNELEKTNGHISQLAEERADTIGHKEDQVKLLESKLIENQVQLTLTQELYDNYHSHSEDKILTLTRDLDHIAREYQVQAELAQTQAATITRLQDDNTASQRHIDGLQCLYDTTFDDRKAVEARLRQEIDTQTHALNKAHKQNISLTKHFEDYKAMVAASSTVKTSIVNDMVDLRCRLMNLELEIKREVQAREKEVKKRVKAEEVNDILLSKISFLKEQLSTAASSDLSQSELVHMMNGHIHTLFRANLLLRRRVLERHDENTEDMQVLRLYNLDPGDYLPQPPRQSPRASTHLPSVNPSGPRNGQHPAGSIGNDEDILLPSTPASLIERSVFDFASAFLSAPRDRAGAGDNSTYTRPKKDASAPVRHHIHLHCILY